MCVCESIERTKIATCIVYRYGKSAQNTIRLRFNCPNRAVTAGREQLAVGNRQSHRKGNGRGGGRVRQTVSEATVTSESRQAGRRAEDELQPEQRPRHSSLNLTCCLFYFQTRFNVVYIYTILVPITPRPPLGCPFASASGAL